MYTREAFTRQRAAAKQVENQQGRWLAFLSVGLGVAQLAFIRWADAHWEKGPKVLVSGTAFLLYAVLIIVLLTRMQRAVKSARPMCPNCGASLRGISERIAAATGRCDTCGGQVIE